MQQKDYNAQNQIQHFKETVYSKLFGLLADINSRHKTQASETLIWDTVRDIVDYVEELIEFAEEKNENSTNDL